MFWPPQAWPISILWEVTGRQGLRGHVCVCVCVCVYVDACVCLSLGVSVVYMGLSVCPWCLSCFTPQCSLLSQ